jgi:hypothetical protein
MVIGTVLPREPLCRLLNHIYGTCNDLYDGDKIPSVILTVLGVPDCGERTVQRAAVLKI